MHSILCLFPNCDVLGLAFDFFMLIVWMVWDLLWTFSICSIKLCLYLYVLLHLSQGSWTLTSWCFVFIWAPKEVLWPKVFWQTWQVIIFFKCTEFIWSSKWWALIKVLPHCLHSILRPSWAAFVCSLRFWLNLNSFWQYSHLCLFPKWTALICLVHVWCDVKVFEHFSQSYDVFMLMVQDL